jgi:hypothetical protein
MKARLLFAFTIAMLSFSAFTACAGPSRAVRVDDAPPGSECTAGGVVVHTGVDDNENGALDDAEIDESEYVCNGDDGKDGTSTLVETADEPPGTNCAHGGLAVRTGIDDDGDGELDNDEVDATAYVCEHRSTLIVASAEPPGENCVAGGVRMTAGVDVDDDGELDDAEIATTTFACHGSDADRVAVRVDVESPGVNCSAGGLEILIGVDANEDGDLDDDEATQSQFVCNGDDAIASLVEVSPEAAGPNCTAGGSLVSTGVDADDDGALDASEVTATAYVCNGAQSVAAVYDARLLDPTPTQNRQFGRYLRMSDDLLLVGSAAIGAAAQPVYVFARNPSSNDWSFVQRIDAPYTGDNAGERFDGRGDVIAISARTNDQEATDRGAVYVYERNATTGVWESLQTLLPNDAAVGQFGSGVAVGNGVILVTTGVGGRVFVFTKNGTTGTWEKTQTLTPPGSTFLYGEIAISGDTFAVGAGASGSPTGKIHVYDRVPATGLWTHSQEVLPTLLCCPQETVSVGYGQYFALDGDRLVAGDPGDDEFATNSGVVYVFDRVVGSGWVQRGSLVPTDAGATFSFGSSVAVSGDFVIGGANGDEFGAASGAAYVFQYVDGSGWVETQRLLSPDKQVDEQFGVNQSIAAAGHSVAIGALSFDHFATQSAGAAHVYDLQP